MVFATTHEPQGKEAFEVTISTRSRRPRQRLRIKKIRRHLNQPMFWPDDDRPVFRPIQPRVQIHERGDITSYGGLCLAHGVATIDIDSTVKPVYGECKRGAEFSYNGKWSYHPLLLTLAQVLPMVNRHSQKVRVRGDSAFYQRVIVAECVRQEAQFALVMDGCQSLHKKLQNLQKTAWQPFTDDAPQPR
jgi:hypothetical protein